MNRFKIPGRLAFGVAVVGLVVGIGFAGSTSMSGRYDGGGEHVLLERPVPAAEQVLTLQEAIALARAELGDSARPVFLARNVGSDMTSGSDGRDAAWTVVLAARLERREVHVQIQSGHVVRIEELPSAGPQVAVETAVDSPAAAKAGRAAGLVPGMHKVGGFGFALRAIEGVSSLGVTGSADGFTGRVELDPATGAARARWRHVPSDQGGVLFSDDTGAHWRATNLSGFVFAVAAFAGNAYAAQQTEHAWSLWKSTGGEQWSRTASIPLPAAQQVYSMVALGPESVLVGTSFGLFRSNDAGRSWQHDTALQGPVQFLARAGGRVVASVTAGAGSGTYIMRGAGQWRRSGESGRLVEVGDGVGVLEEGRTSRLIDNADAVTLLNVPFRTLRLARIGNVWLAGAPEAVYRSIDHGASWTRTLASGNGSLLAAADGTVIVGGLRSPTYRSVDQGQNWEVAFASATSLCAGSNEIPRLLSLDAGRLIAIHGGTREWRTY
jgi:hypothetical protein